MQVESDREREQIRRRLSRIEGQVRGVARMLDEGRDCREIVQQIAAVRSAVHQAGLEVMRVHASQCLRDPASATTNQEVVEYLVGTLGKWS